jgi:hypothetical protein
MSITQEMIQAARRVLGPDLSDDAIRAGLVAALAAAPDEDTLFQSRRLNEEAKAAALILGSITLADVALRTTVLTVACTRCDRTGRYDVDTLVARHGPASGIPMLLGALSADCPRRLSVLCGVHCPDLAGLLLNRPGKGA